MAVQSEVEAEFLGEMLGVRRAGATVAAGMLQKAGLIACGRGVVRVLDAQGLHHAACRCYDVIRQHSYRPLGYRPLLAPILLVAAAEVNAWDKQQIMPGDRPSSTRGSSVPPGAAAVPGRTPPPAKPSPMPVLLFV